MNGLETAGVAPQNTKETIKISVVGAGDIGRRHMRAIKENRLCQLSGIVDPQPNGTMASSEFQAPLFQDIDRMIDDIQPDGVVIAAPNAFHVALTEKCIDRNIPVLLEKPIAADVSSAYSLAVHAEESGVPLMVGHHRRHNPIVGRAREIIEKGLLGDINLISATWLVRKPDDYFDVRWRREHGGGPVLINLVHDIDTLRYLAGEIIEIQAIASNRNRGFEVEDTAAVIVRFASGALGTILLSDATPSPWSWELTSGEVTSYTYPRVHSDCYLFAGSIAALALPSLRLWKHPLHQSWRTSLQEERYTVEERDPLAIQLAHFLDVINGVSSPIVSARDAARTLEVTLAVSEAARTRRRVILPMRLNAESEG